MAKRAGLASGAARVGGRIHARLPHNPLPYRVFGRSTVFLSLWVSAFIVSGILLLIGGILAWRGASILRGLDPKPHRTIATLQQNINWIKGQLR